MTKEEIYADIVAGVLAAMACQERGDSHPRSNMMMARTAARNAAFFPPCPIHLLPIGRQPFSRDNPLGGDVDVGAWYEGMTGRFGAQRND